MKVFPLSFLFFFSSLLSSYGQGHSSVDFAHTITPSDLKKHLSILASDAYEGRETGEKGQKMAAEYIAHHFKTIGLAPIVDDEGGKSYFQKFELLKQSWGEVSIKIGDEEKIFLQDFYAYGDYVQDTWKTSDVIFAGYGIEDKNYNDYAQIDVKGKSVVIYIDEPMVNGKSLVTGNEQFSKWNRDWRLKVKTAKKNGALEVFIIIGDDLAFKKRLAWLKNYIAAPALTFPKGGEEKPFAFFIPSSLAAELLHTTPKKLEKITTKNLKKGKPIPYNKFKSDDVSYIVERKSDKVPTENVLGFLEGSEKKEEVLVITAHYDHLGKTDSLIFNGADDDGSGTVSLLEISEAFSVAKKDGFGPKRSILFMSVTGEEKGLLGSEFYTDHPLFPLENHVANLNVDMVGRIDEKHALDSHYVYLIGSDRLSMDLHELSEEVNKAHTQLELDYTYNDPNDPNRFYYRSDHYNFAKNLIPVIFYFSGVHEDYHQATDTYDKIMYTKMSRIGQLIFHTAWELVNRDERIQLIEGIENE